ncbi:MAG: adenylosuccinate lyase, partial [Gammaproteobacteria bacterium]|nr:adenylosuccinate lyase [Gammaproteobacteria bacterium]
IAPDSTMLVDFMLQRLMGVLKGLDVFPENMQANIELSLGLCTSQDVLLKLTEAGMIREDAYQVVQKAAMKAWQEKINFKDIILADATVQKHLPAAEIEKLFDVKNHLKYVDEIFNRVFK